MFKKIILTSLILLCSSFAFAESYPPEMLEHFSKEYLDYYFSLPLNERTDETINNFGQYEISHDGPAFNAVYKPDTVITPFRPKWQQAEADYYDTLPTE